MTRLTVLTAPDPRLKITARPVSTVDANIQRLMDDMLETMYAEDGIGLAATQVGVNWRVIVMNASREEGPPDPALVIKMANPEIYWRSEEMSSINEACLSVPGYHGPVERPAMIRVRYLDENNILRDVETGELLATCIQHEIDHLNGILFIDHFSRLKRDMILRKLTKNRQSIL